MLEQGLINAFLIRSECEILWSDTTDRYRRERNVSRYCFALISVYIPIFWRSNKYRCRIPMSALRVVPSHKWGQLMCVWPLQFPCLNHCVSAFQNTTPHGLLIGGSSGTDKYRWQSQEELQWGMSPTTLRRPLSHAVTTPTHKVKVKLSLCFHWAPLHEGVSGEWG
jgi:hypothetical protein